MWRTAGLVGLIALVALAGVLFWRTSTFGPKTGPAAAEVELPAPPAFDLDRAAASLGSAVRFRTVTLVAGDPQPGGEAPWTELQAHLAATYPKVFAAAEIERPAGLTLLMTWRGSDANLPPLILMAHQDVVPINIGSEPDWTHGPFAGAVADGHVWGRGAMDDKGSLIAILEAAEALAATGWRPKRTVIFLFGHDEEVSGAGAQAAFALLKSRNVRAAMVLDEGLAVLAQNPLTGKPAALIGVAEKGYVSLRLTARHEGGHASRPPRDSGAVRISKAVLALEETQMPANLSAAPFPDMIRSMADDLPFATRMAFANQWMFGPVIAGQLTDPSANAMVRTTTAPTMLEGSVKDNVLPQRASAVVNFRIHPRDSIEAVIAHVKAATKSIPDLDVEIYGGGIGSEPSPVSSTSSEAYRILEAVARQAGGGDIPVSPGLMIAATDSRYATPVSEDAVYRFVPAIYTDADLAGFHGTNERLSVDNLGRMIRAYAQLMLAMCG